MSNTTTPETDAEQWTLNPYGLDELNGERVVVEADFARRLERARNEWREAAEKHCADAVSLGNERDEARAEVAKLNEELEIANKTILRLTYEVSMWERQTERY